MRTVPLTLTAAALTIVAVLVTPAIVYIWTFGPQLSNSHARWAEFGSAMGGIYAPILSVLTLLVLFIQYLVQRAQAKHQFDHAFLSQSRADIEFYALRLADVLNTRITTGNTFREILRAHFEPANSEALHQPSVLALAKQLHDEVPEVAGCWAAVLPVLQGLSSVQDRSYKLTHGSAHGKLAAVLTYRVCVALDNYLFVHAAAQSKSLRFEFSPVVATR